jgi:hypothetical protein
MTDNAQNLCAADAYTINAIAAIVRREGQHNYAVAAGTQVAALCGVTVTWNAGVIRLAARDVEAVMDSGAVTFTRGNTAALRDWHRVLADLDNVFLRRLV